MSYIEKCHASHKAASQHLSYLDSLMDETDREVMSLTDRAFKSLCIGDDAIYNDSGLSPSPVNLHKPLAEDKSRKPREKLFSDVKNHGVQPSNGLTSKPWQMIENSSKLSSLFGAFSSERFAGNTALTNGDSWDKSALLSIQKELSEFSYQNHFADEPFHYGSYHESLENRSNEDSKNKLSKNSRLKNLNSKNSFLHSEFSAFRSWSELNRFHLDSITQKILQTQCPAQFHNELVTSNKSPALGSVIKTGHKSSASVPWEPEQIKSTPGLLKDSGSTESKQTARTQDVEDAKLKLDVLKTPQLQVQMPSGVIQRCQSDGDLSAPWRKKTKDLSPSIQRLCLLETEPRDEDVMPVRTKVQTMEEPVSTSSTPFSISHLLTPVISSRQGTETSEVLQASLSPLTVNLPRILKMEAQPSPEIKRESYKAMASGLLFNLKDNRKRVKAMYSPPRFKPSNSSTKQNESPSQVEPGDHTKLPVPDTSGSKATSAEQHEYLCSPRLRTADPQRTPSTPCNLNLNSSLQNDSLQSPVLNLSYSSLNTYQKASPLVSESRTLPVDFSVNDKEPSKAIEKNQISIQPLIDEKRNPRHPEKVSIKTRHKSLSGNKDKINVEETDKGEERSTKQNENCPKDTRNKHLFSARQNNYIKSQRYLNEEEKGVAYEYQPSHLTKERISLGKKDKGNIDVKQDTLKQKTLHHHSVHLGNDLRTYSEQLMSKNNALSMKGNTSAKIALFDPKDKETNTSHHFPELKKEEAEMETSKQALIAPEEIVARREQQRKFSQSNSRSSTETQEICGYIIQQGEGDCRQATAEGSGQKVISDSNPTSQNVRSTSGTNTKHGERHMTEINLAHASEQEEHSLLKTDPIKPKEVDMSGRLSQQAEADEVWSNDRKREKVKGSAALRSLKDRLKVEVTQRRTKEDSQRGDKSGKEIKDNYLDAKKIQEGLKSANVKNVQEWEVRKCHRELSERSTEPSENVQESLTQFQGPKNDIRSQNVGAFNYTSEQADDLTLDAGHDEEDINVSEDLLVLGRHSKISDFFHNCVDKSDDKRDKIHGYKKILQNSELGKHDVQKVSELEENLVYQTLGYNKSSDFKESSISNKRSESSDEAFDFKISLEQMAHNSESKVHFSSMKASLTNTIQNKGWVESLPNSGTNLTSTCQSNASSPTIGKLPLFKVKDNTFSSSPVTKTVRPTLYKTVSGITQAWSPQDSLSGSERGYEDSDLLKDGMEIQSPVLQSNKLRIQSETPPAFQPTLVQKQQEQRGGHKESHSTISSVPERFESCRTSAEDIAEEPTFKTTPSRSKEGAKALSERSESVCSGNECQSQNKPPNIPPKSEKALRRAMKLTSRRIQKATETKNKTERGRSSEKYNNQKHEKKPHSSNKDLSKPSFNQDQNTKLVGINRDQNTKLMGIHERFDKDSDQVDLRKTQDAGVTMTQNSNSHIKESWKLKPKSHQKDSLNNTMRSKEDDDISDKRPGRLSEKHLPDKVSRRALSLDRYSCGKHQHRMSGTSKCTYTDSNSSPSTQKEPFHLSRQNSMELMYTPPTTNIVTQSFPLTQQKLLQDPDSGRYFVVNMPVTVTTKTFFDPETGSYVQLPVQSLDAQSQAVEVLKTPTLMLYHGFVPEFHR